MSVATSLSVFACLMAAGLTRIGCTEVHANDLPDGKAQQHRADTRCAIYGPGFTAVEGSDTCVRIGGRVRVEVGTHPGGPADSGWANSGIAPAGMRSDTAPAASPFDPTPTSSVPRSHIRLRDLDQDPFRH